MSGTKRTSTLGHLNPWTQRCVTPLHHILFQEVTNNHLVSQWWGHHRLHQNEVIECRGTGNPQKVNCSDTICQLTTVSRHPIAQMNLKDHEGEEDHGSTSQLSIAWPLTAFKNHRSVELDNQSSLRTLISFPLNHPLVHSSATFQDNVLSRKPNSFQTHLSYACSHCIDTFPFGTLKTVIPYPHQSIDCYTRASLTLSMPGPSTASS